MSAFADLLALPAQDVAKAAPRLLRQNPFLIEPEEDEQQEQQQEKKQPTDKQPEKIPEDDGGFVPETTLMVAMLLWHKKLGMGLTRLAIAGLRGFAEQYPGPAGFRWSTACSGTDILMVVCRRLAEVWVHLFNVYVVFTSVFACEIQPDKQKFLISQHKCPVIFNNVVDLKSFKAHDIVSGGLVMVPFADGFGLGSSCVSRSPASKNSAKNLNCIQEDSIDAETAVTWKGGYNYIVKAGSALLLIENVKELLQKLPGETEISDAEFMLAQITAQDYAAAYMIFDAADYGSPAVRIRIYFFGYKGNSRFNRARVRLVGRLMNAMEIEDALPVSDFLLSLEDLHELDFGAAGFTKGKKSKVDESKCMYKDEHMLIFAACKMEWPPNLHSPEASCIDFSGMTHRMMELAWFVHFCFPPSEDQTGKYEFCDINEQMRRLVCFDESKEEGWIKDPWRASRLGTLTGHSSWLVRFNGKDGDAFVRLVTGIELMRIIGWDLEDWRGRPDCFHEEFMSHDLLKGLAGNAWSAFAVGPLLSSLVIASGIPDEELEDVEPDDVQDVFSVPSSPGGSEDSSLS